MIFQNAVFVGGPRVNSQFIEETIDAIVEVRRIMRPNESTTPLDIEKAFFAKGFLTRWTRVGVDGIEWRCTINLPEGM